jgi:hypothetical protein
MIQNCVPRSKIDHSFVNDINLICRQGAVLLFNDGEYSLLVLPLQQCCLSKIALAIWFDLLSLQLDSIILTNCFLFPLIALLPELLVSQVAVDSIHQPVYLVEFFDWILHEVVESAKVS